MKEEVKQLSPTESWELILSDPSSLLIDVRSSMEFLMVGHPQGAINTPWIDEPDWEPDPDFVKHVRNLLLGGVVCDEGHCPPILLICRSGNRSHEAGQKLVDEGIANVFNIIDGFEGPRDDDHHRSTISGWRKDGLPWEQC